MTWILRLALSLAVPTAFAGEDPAKMNAFIDKLMAKMTLEEKAGQLVQFSADMNITGSLMKENFRDEVAKGLVGSVFNAYSPEATRALQKLAVEKTRLKIPLLFGHDVIHGHRTIFPIPLGESSSWDLKAIETAAHVAAREAAADGIHWTFAPMVDISRDPRWGRITEGAGEDPWLGAKVAAARVRGFQGTDLTATDRVLACGKHFAAYGAPVGGRDYNVVDVSERELFETYLPPYQAAVNAGVGTMMTAFNEISGVPSTSNPFLLTDVLRKKWGFKGFVVTDYTAIRELINHGVAKDDRDAARLAFNAGADMDMQDGIYGEHLADLVRKGQVKLADLNASVRRVLEAKYRRGLFTDPYRYSDNERAQKEHLSAQNRAAARDVARRSIVLLKNSGDVLPLKKDTKVALIGPLAENALDMLGAWASVGEAKHVVTLKTALAPTFGDRLLYAKGANIVEEPALVDFVMKHNPPWKLDERSAQEMLKEAVSVAKKSDVVVLALGESRQMSGEAASMTKLRLPEPQRQLLKAVKATGKPVVLVLFNGRPLVLEDESGLVDAMLETWFLGTEAGHAIADVLLGDYNPSGKLTVSFPRNEGQIPIYYSQKPTGRPASPTDKYTTKYLDVDNEPLYPFGFGLSYTKYQYSDLKISSEVIAPKDKLKVSVNVTNVGPRAGEEVVQLYIRDVIASVTRPLKQLRGFQKVQLNPSETKTVTFAVSTDDLRFYDRGQWVLEPGEFRVMVGPNSKDLMEKPFHVRAAAAQASSVTPFHNL